MDSPKEMVELANEKIHPRAGTFLVWCVYLGVVSAALLAFGAFIATVQANVIGPVMGLVPAMDGALLIQSAVSVVGSAVLAWAVVRMVVRRFEPIVKTAAGWGRTLLEALQAQEVRISALEDHTDIHGLRKQLAEQFVREHTDGKRLRDGSTRED